MLNLIRHTLLVNIGQLSPRWPSLILILLSPSTWYPVGKKRQVQADKLRDIVKFEPTDLAMARGLAKTLSRLHGSFLPCVHSYLPKKDQMTAIKSLQKYLRHYRRITSKENRNLYVLRVDIKKCGESIYVGEKSLLWQRFIELGVNKSELLLLKRGLRPEIDDKGTRLQFLYGTPTGSPLQPLALNVYLSLLDEAIYHQVGKGFYLRFGDDILLIHPDLERFKSLVKIFEDRLCSLELSMNEKKRSLFQYNGAARKILSDMPARDHLEYLGMSVSFHGGAAISSEKTHKLVKDFGRLCKKLRFVERSKRLVMAQDALLQFFSSRSPLGHESMDSIYRKVDDRIWMKDVNYKMSKELQKVFHSKQSPQFYWKRLGLPFWGKKN